MISELKDDPASGHEDDDDDEEEEEAEMDTGAEETDAVVEIGNNEKTRPVNTGAFLIK
jgi:hypothetical protein